MASHSCVCHTGPRWVRDRLQDKSALAPLTGQDWPALKAFFHLVELWGNSDEPGRESAVRAMAHVLLAMQPKMRRLAKAGIPHVLDWSHETEIWAAVASAWQQLTPAGSVQRLEILEVDGGTHHPCGCITSVGSVTRWCGGNFCKAFVAQHDDHQSGEYR